MTEARPDRVAFDPCPNCDGGEVDDGWRPYSAHRCRYCGGAGEVESEVVLIDEADLDEMEAVDA